MNNKQRTVHKDKERQGYAQKVKLSMDQHIKLNHGSAHKAKVNHGSAHKAKVSNGTAHKAKVTYGTDRKFKEEMGS